MKRSSQRLEETAASIERTIPCDKTSLYNIIIQLDLKTAASHIFGPVGIRARNGTETSGQRGIRFIDRFDSVVGPGRQKAELTRDREHRPIDMGGNDHRTPSGRLGADSIEALQQRSSEKNLRLIENVLVGVHNNLISEACGIELYTPHPGTQKRSEVERLFDRAKQTHDVNLFETVRLDTEKRCDILAAAIFLEGGAIQSRIMVGQGEQTNTPRAGRSCENGRRLFERGAGRKAGMIVKIS